MSRRDTRELILATSLALFNGRGEHNVSTNEIALEADISPGNLYYHFRNRDDIALELFKRFALDMQPLLVGFEDGGGHIEDLCLRLHLMFETMGRYRFIYRDFADLGRRIPDLGRAMKGLIGRQRSALDAMVASLANDGTLHADADARRALVDNAVLLLTQWIALSDLLDPHGLDDGRAQADAVFRLLQLFLPHLDARAADDLRVLAATYRRD